MAAAGGLREAAIYRVDCGADIKPEIYNGCTPLIVADIKPENYNGSTPLIVAGSHWLLMKAIYLRLVHGAELQYEAGDIRDSTPDGGWHPSSPRA